MGTNTAARPRSVRSERKWEAASHQIVGAFAAQADDGTPVYLRLKRCIADLILSAELPMETQLPPEQWLARSLGVSLGTVQKSLNALHADGFVQRRQGHGTYVNAPRRPMTELWHYRFFDAETEGFAPVFSRCIGRRIVNSAEAARILGNDPKGFVEIQREIDVAGEIACHSRIYLGASHFGALMEVDETLFENVNLKSIFSSRFGRPTLEAIQRIHLAPPSREAQKTLKLPGDALAMVLTVIAKSHSGPYSFQEAHIPPSRFRLDVSLTNDVPQSAERM